VLSPYVRNPLIGRQIREIGLNLHSLDQLLTSPPATLRREAFLHAISNLGNLCSLCLCCHQLDRSLPPASETLRFIPSLVTNISSNLASLSLHLPAALWSTITGGDAPSFPDLRLETLRISITNGYDRWHQSCPPDQLIALIGKTVSSVKSLEFYCWVVRFNMSDFLKSLVKMRLPHLEKFGLGLYPYSNLMTNAAGIKRFLLAHNSTLTELSLTHGSELEANNLEDSHEWYRDCIRGLPLNQTLRKLLLSILYTKDFITPQYVSILGSIYTSLESLTLLTPPLSLYDVEMLLQLFTCDQLKSLKLHVRSLDTKLLELLKERCPNLQELVLKLWHDDYDEAREPISRRVSYGLYDVIMA
jgi:hypothetical protein